MFFYKKEILSVKFTEEDLKKIDINAITNFDFTKFYERLIYIALV